MVTCIAEEYIQIAKIRHSSGDGFGIVWCFGQRSMTGFASFPNPPIPLRPPEMVTRLNHRHDDVRQPLVLKTHVISALEHSTLPRTSIPGYLISQSERLLFFAQLKITSQRQRHVVLKTGLIIQARKAPLWYVCCTPSPWLGPRWMICGLATSIFTIWCSPWL